MRSGAATFNVMHNNSDGTWHYLGRISFQSAERKVDAGKWQRVYNQQNLHIGYEICDSNPEAVLASLHREVKSKVKLGPVRRDKATAQASAEKKVSICISSKEMQIYAGQVFKHGKSRTYGMTDEQRASRISERGNRLSEEDAVERVVAKVELWPHPASRVAADERAPYGDRAVRVYPKA